MEFSAQMIAGLVGGTIVGNPEATVADFAKIEEGRPGCISVLANDKYEHYIYTTESSIVLVNDTFEPKHDIKATLIKVANAREAVANLINIFQPDVLCIGGGISKQGDTLIKPLRKVIDEEQFTKNSKKKTKICEATLGNDAGIIGAALLYRQK